MCLEADFAYIDPSNRSWSVRKDFVVDGASIPRILWNIVGSPYTGDYRRASIVHDYWCQQNGWQGRLAADRMFRHACLDGGCSPQHAWLLYIGVRIGAYTPFFTVSPAQSATYSAFEYEQTPGLSPQEEAQLLAFQEAARLTNTRLSNEASDDDLADIIDKTVELSLSRTGVLHSEWTQSSS